jgi:heme/copper-type cytochrome/quinol oxidase subunit 1
MGRTIPIETISPIEEIESEHMEYSKSRSSSFHGVITIIACLLLLFLGVMLIFGLCKPYFVLNPNTEELDWGKMVLASFIVALLATIILWIIFACCS